MTRRIVLKRGVPDDLHNIVIYLEERSIAAADRFVDAVFAAFDDLAEMPGMGKSEAFSGKTLIQNQNMVRSGFS